MATKLTVMKVSEDTAKRLRAMKKQYGVSLGILADLGLDHFWLELKRGNVVIQNGKIVPAPQEAA